MKKVKVLFVCMGNICRSPTAHGVFEKLLKDKGLEDFIEVDSAGTYAYHVGEAPDKRAQATALKRGFDLEHLKARKVAENDFSYYDYILAMDNDNLDMLYAACPAKFKNKISLLLHFADNFPISEVPDPYYGGVKGFENVFDMIDTASRGLLEDIKKKII
jgi:protein-tyrosine phosphatase